MQTFLIVLLLWLLVPALVIGLILLICWVGSRGADEQLSPDSHLNYGTRHSDHPLHRCARRREDDVRDRFEVECGL